MSEMKFTGKGSLPFWGAVQQSATKADQSICDTLITYGQLAVKNENELVLLKDEVSYLKALVGLLEEGLDDHWVTLPENKLIVERCKQVVDKK